MDITRYVGLFLLKNHFCYVHGLGNLELKKLPGNFDGKLLLAPTYNIVVTSGGSIDDNLANFIATNEQVSISKASNELREFSERARKDLDNGKEVELPGLGKFVLDGGRVGFVTDENFSFSPAGLPTIRNSKQLEDHAAKPAPIPASIPIPPAEKKKSVNWTMIILIIVLLVLIGGGGLGYYYYAHSKNKKPVTPVAPYNPEQARMDSMRIKADSIRVADSIHTVLADTLPVDHRVIIGLYNDLPSADKYVRKLKKSGNEKAEVYVKDTANYFILTQISCRNKDTVMVFDSLKRVFSFQDVKSFK